MMESDWDVSDDGELWARGVEAGTINPSFPCNTTHSSYTYLV